MGKMNRQHFPAMAGFTLVEMLVAVAMGAALIAAAATVFSMASQGVGSSQATTEMTSQLRIVWSWLDRDFEGIRLDGPLVLVFQEQVTDTGELKRIDRMDFLICGNIPSIDAPDYNTALAIVCYAPDSSTDSPLVAPYHWSLTRRATLIASTLPQTGGIDVVSGSFAELIANPASPTWNLARTKAILSDKNDQWAQSTRLMDNVLSFRVVRYRIAGSDPVEVTGPGFLWCGPADPKPAWIEFEIRLRDRANRLPTDFVSIYRVNLPTR